MTAALPYQADIDAILSHRRDNGADYWTTPDRRLLKGAPFTTLESALYLLELGVPPEDAVLQAVADLIFCGWREDGRIKTAPTGSIYPCHTALAANVLCRMGCAGDPRLQKTFSYFLDTQQPDGGWKCSKFSYGRGPETSFSTPYTTLTALDMFRFSPYLNRDARLDRAVEFLLEHWRIRTPISPCHYGIGTLFMQAEYPFRGYNLFYYTYVLSFYDCAKRDPRFLEAFAALKGKTVQGAVIVERVVPKLARLTFCKKGAPSVLAGRRYEEILHNLEQA